MRVKNVLLATFAISVSGLAADPEPFLGTWKLNVAKSNFGGALKPRSGSVRFEHQTKDVLLIYREHVGASGKVDKDTIPMRWDGEDHVIANGGGMTISRTRPDSRTVVATLKNHGRETEQLKWVISQDGQTATLTRSGGIRNGKPFTTEFVYEREDAPTLEVRGTRAEHSKGTQQP